MPRLIAKHLNKDVQLEPSEAKRHVMDLAEEQGVKLPYGCRSGTCGVCRARVCEGMELLAAPMLIEQDTLANCQDEPNIRLMCQARFVDGAKGTLVLDEAPEIS